jgi:hypothetical protein
MPGEIRDFELQAFFSRPHDRTAGRPLNSVHAVRPALLRHLDANWIEHSPCFRGRERLFLPEDRWQREGRRPCHLS